MNPIDWLAWRSVTAWLERYSRRQASVRHCFVRHSTAFEAQNVLVSDYDLAFFVDARDFDELRTHTVAIRGDLKRARVLDAIVLPATEAAYRLAATHYVHRSLYPMQSWRCVYGKPLAPLEAPCPPPPLDHSPEGFLYGYLVPAFLERIRRHPFEKALLRRKSERERLQYGEQSLARSPMTFGEVLAEQVWETWDRFYAQLHFPSPDRPMAVRPIRSSACEPFVHRWMSSRVRHELLPAVDSVWVYPAFNNDRVARVVVNVQPQISAAHCLASLGFVAETFHGLEFDLLIGTERSMLGRLGGLSRVSLLEPWLCRTFGHCLYGDEELGQQVREPRSGEVEDKLRELYLYLSYRVFPGTVCPYPLYRLCFTLDHLFERSELVVDGEDLLTIYGRDMLPESEFAGPRAKQHLLGAWRDLHRLDLFETV